MMSEGPLCLVYLDVKNKEQDALIDMTMALKKVEREIPSFLGYMLVEEDFFVFFRLDVDERSGMQQVEEYRKLLKVYVENEFRLRRNDISGIALRLGCSLVRHSSKEDMSKNLYRSIKEAIRNAKNHEQDSNSKLLSDEFQRILKQQLIYSVYQPIICLTTSTIFGHEALTRGPEKSVFSSPLKLFDFAHEDGSLYFLDKLAREKAIIGSSNMERRQKLFINIPSHIMHHPEFTPGQTLMVLESVGLQPNHIVFEITERSSIEDFTTAKKVLEHYRSQGYQVAIDDAGAGYSSLQAIAEIQPDYIKVDRSLIHDIHKDRVKECILETFVTFASKMNIRIIAEGIEQQEELAKLMQMGVHYAQGYLLGRPSARLETEISPILSNMIEQLKASRSMFTCGVTVGEIVEEAKAFAHDEPCSNISCYFRDHEHAQGVVIVNHHRPVGLMMREKLFQQLAGQYGLPLYWSKPVRHIMDARPLIVEAQSTLEEVSRIAMSRDLKKLYDLVIVTHHNKLVGVASIQSILEKLTQLRMEAARVSNPLTGLPGNMQIQQEMKSRINCDQRLNIIYADLDFFKWYNDTYGFQKGDGLIQFTADVIQRCVIQYGEKGDFVGHIGGDDFIIMSSATTPEMICEKIIEHFDEGISAFYDNEVEVVVDRQGNMIAASGVTISLSLITCECTEGVSPDVISQSAAKIKKQAKAHIGSVYVKKNLVVGKQRDETRNMTHDNDMDTAIYSN